MVAALPRLRGLALALTRSRSEAEDLVQEVAVAALSGRHTFAPGTNFSAWLSTIMRNRARLDHRRRRETTSLDDLGDGSLAIHPAQDERILLENLHQVLKGLPVELRHALAMVASRGLSYEQAAALIGCATGTVKSRVFRARRTLHNKLLYEAF